VLRIAMGALNSATGIFGRHSRARRLFVRAQMTLIEIKPHGWGWNVFLATGVEPRPARKVRQLIGALWTTISRRIDSRPTLKIARGL
jgi:hypothetical protein